MDEKIKRYNQLTASWIKGTKWLNEGGRSPVQMEKGEKRLFEILDEMKDLYNELKEKGIEVEPEKYIT